MLKGGNSIRVVVLAALVLVVSLSSTVGSRLTVVGIATTTRQAREGTAQAQRLNSAWKAQLSNEQSQLQDAQRQQAQEEDTGGPSTLVPATPTPAPASTPSTSATGTVGGQVGGSIQAIIQAVFAPLGAAAVQWAVCIALHESTDNPYAVSPTGAEGLFQFIPSTFAGTPPGRAGASIWDPTASAQAAAWMYTQGRQGEWSTNFEC